jgi:hypothetical protein
MKAIEINEEDILALINEYEKLQGEFFLKKKKKIKFPEVISKIYEEIDLNLWNYLKTKKQKINKLRKEYAKKKRSRKFGNDNYIK